MGQIHRTRDYDMFSLISGNRDVKKLGILESEISRKNMLPAFPIIVNTRYEVLDGQHRLAVAKRLGLEVSYIVDDSIKLQDIPLAANCVRKWNMEDHLKHYATRGNKNYVELQRLLSEFPFATVALVLHIVPRAGFGQREQWFQSGEFSSAGLDHVRKTLAQCARYANVVYRDGYRKRVFICTMSRLVKMDWFDGERLFKKISGFPSLFVPCVDVQQCVEMLERIYNYRAQHRVSFFDAA